MRALHFIPAILLSSCSWHYVATREPIPNGEKIVFRLDGYDVLYGGGQGKAPPWAISYPSSALDPATGTVNARDFTKVEVESKDVKSSVSGFLSMRGSNKVEARLVQTLARPDGSRYSMEAPFNGVHRLRNNER